MTDPNAYGQQNAAKLAAALQEPPNASMLPAPDLEMAAPPDTQAIKRHIRREHMEQVTLFDQIRAAERMGRPGADMIFAVPNGTAAGAKVGAAMVREGVMRGVPDIVVAVPRAGKCGLFVEMKLPGGVPSDVSPEQRAWLMRLANRGYDTEVAFGWRHAWRVLCDYLGWEGLF